MYFELDGERIPFDKTTVPNPPQISFASDVSQLFREWHQSNLLVVGGRGIPIKHWIWFYKKRAHIKGHVWDVIRAKWNKWKSIVEEREKYPSEEAFWEKYSDPETGKRLTQQGIIVRIQTNRAADNKRDADAALEFFGGNLARQDAHGYFTYTKNNITSLCTKPEAIARKWRELLVSYPEIATAWQQMHA
ncbi:hypothetical protein BC628DRAFT_918558 [Trametes gibbosa]|nr:hypothetical protein BC628DRAFT_918558 [Trametes gibbosa]